MKEVLTYISLFYLKPVMGNKIAIVSAGSSFFLTTTIDIFRVLIMLPFVVRN